jgi:hypothetical protein
MTHYAHVLMRAMVPITKSAAVYGLVFEQANGCLLFRRVDERSELNFPLIQLFLSGPRVQAWAVLAWS